MRFFSKGPRVEGHPIFENKRDAENANIQLAHELISAGAKQRSNYSGYAESIQQFGESIADKALYLYIQSSLGAQGEQISEREIWNDINHIKQNLKK